MAVIVSKGIRVPSYEVPVVLIDFTIAGTAYQAEAGMTWYEWCNSSYNTGGFTTTSSPSAWVNKGSSTTVQYNGVNVKSQETIVANASYTTKISIM